MENRVLYFLILVFAFASCQSLNDLDVDEGLKKIHEHIPELPSLNTTNLPKVADVEKVLREKCKNQGAEHAVEDIKAQQEAARDCVEQYVDFSVVQEELEVAKETGSMDEVFGKYCKKWPEIYACLDNVTSIARQCMDDDEKISFNKSLDILKELQEFVCFKDGDRLAMFVAEGGVECVRDRKDGVQQCINTTVGTRMPAVNDLSITTLPTLLYTTKDCEDFETIRQCVNKELEHCEDSTPANIVDAFFKFLKKHLPCNIELEKPLVKQAEVGAVSGGISMFTMPSVVLVIVFIFGSRFLIN